MRIKSKNNEKDTKNIGIVISVYVFFYLITSFILWDFDLSVMQPGDRCAMAFVSTLVIGAILYFNEISDI